MATAIAAAIAAMTPEQLQTALTEERAKHADLLAQVARQSARRCCRDVGARAPYDA